MTAKTYLALGVAAALMGGGWAARGWYEASVDLAQQKAAQAAIEAFERKESAIAATVEQKLAGLKDNERVIERHRTKVVERPVYRSVCLDDDGVRLLNRYANGFATDAAAEVPGETAPSGR